MSAPRLWFPLDALFPDQEIVKALQRDCGPGGPWVLVFLLCEAYKRHFLKERPSGVVNMSFERLARDAGLEDREFDSAEEVARRAMRNLSVAGIVELVEGDLESATFRLRFSKWSEWLPDHFADPTHNERQAAYKAKKSARSNPGVTDSTADGAMTEDDAKRERESKPPPAPAREEIVRLSSLLAQLILKRDPKARVAPTSKHWLDPIRLLIDKDGRSEAEVEHVIRWAQQNDFWQSNILSTAKLRDKFTMLIAKAGRPKGNADDFFQRNGM